MRASVIVPVYNGEETVEGCLAALVHQSAPREDYEVIVVDDGSTDGTAAIVSTCQVVLLRQPQSGQAAARNLGASQAKGEIFLFTDADCAPEEDWIERLLEPFERKEVVGAKGVYRTRQRALVARFVQLEYEDKYARLEREEYIDFIDTYSAAYRREVFLANGGFDARFLIDEDQEFSFRLAKGGYKMVFAPRAVVYHQHTSTLTAYVRRKFHIGRWKVAVHARHPDKALRDSRTPPVLKVQVALFPFLVSTLALACGQLIPWQVFGLTLVVFFLTTVPFSIRAMRKDSGVGLASPFLLLVRAAALAVGLGAGLVGGLWIGEERRIA
jgi:cellulose synthase/poly-beta-1,6-N-acetylglucosamine synthase-like glycosyltransferase